MLGRLIKRLLHRLIRGLVRARLALLVIVVLLIALAALGGLQSVQLPALGFSLPGPKRAPDATENYMKGLQSYNAELICSSLSDEVLDRLRARAGSCLEIQQRQLDLSRERGQKFEQINYVGGYGLPDGTAYQFYVVASRGPITRSEGEYVTYIFTLDRSGKISKVQ
jgi:hypothetical protein